MSLPLAFETDLSSIPAVVPYVRSDPARVAAWRERLGREDQTARGTGVERKRGPQERQAQHGAWRRCCRWSRTRWAEWVSLQKEVREPRTWLCWHRVRIFITSATS